MKNFKTITISVFIISILSFISICYITYDLIIEEKNRQFKIDFVNKSDTISSYGALISGLLSFLSILFVIYALVSQKNEQNLKENEEKKNNTSKLLENYKVFIFYLNTLIQTLNELNINLKHYCENENTNPTFNNPLLFSINKNFSRVIEMDVKATFTSFQNFYISDNKEKDFVQLYKLIDFYSDLYFSIRTDYESTKNFRYEKLVNFGFEILELYNKKSDMIDAYKLEFPNIYRKKPWVEIANKSIGNYYKYIDECESKKKQHDFDYISNNIFKPFLDSALALRDNIGYGNNGAQEIVRVTSTLRKKLFYIKSRVLNNSETLEITRKEYLDENSEHLKKFKDLINRLEQSIKA